jgi:dynein heavy chain
MAVPPSNVDEARKLKDGLGDDFSVEVMKNKSQAAGGLCAWVINIIKYYDVVVDTEPKKRSLQEAEASLEQANQRKEEKQQLVKSLQEKLDALVAEFQKATAEKDAVMAEAERCQTKLRMANRLINALSANGEIWKLTLRRPTRTWSTSPGTPWSRAPLPPISACSRASTESGVPRGSLSF